MMPRYYSNFICFAILTLLLSGRAQAKDWYTGLDIGYGTAQVDTRLGPTDVRSGFSLGGGVVFDVTPRLSAELDYLSIGQHAASYQLPPTLAQQDGIVLAGLVKQSVRGLNVFLKAGGAHVYSETHYILPYIRCTQQKPNCAQVLDKQQVTVPIVGLGAEWNHADWRVRVQYERVSLQPAHSDFLTVGLYRRWR
jgi:hypothetical protein